MCDRGLTCNVIIIDMVSILRYFDGRRVHVEGESTVFDVFSRHG